MHRLRKRWVANTLLAFFLIIFAIYFIYNIEKFKVLLNVNIRTVILVVIGHVGVITANALFQQHVLLPLGKKISFFDSFDISFFTTLGNFFAPFRAGLGVRAVYLKKKYKVKYSEFLSTLSGNYVISFFTASALGIISLVSLYSPDLSLQFWPFTIFMSGIALVTLLVMIVPLDFFLKFSKLILRRWKKTKIVIIFLEVLGDIFVAWEKIIKDKKLIIKLIFFTLLNFSLSMFISYVLITGIGANISLWSLVFYSAIGNLSLLVSITPGSLGIKESIYIAGSLVLGLTVAEILSVSLLNWAIKSVVLGLGFFIIRLMANKRNSKVDSL